MTKRCYLPCLLLALCLGCSPLAAQSSDSGKDDNISGSRMPVWSFKLNDSLRSCIKLNNICSASLHSYMLEGKVKISELTVDTLGNNSLRFYCIDSERVKTMEKRLSNTKALLNEKSEGAMELPSRKFPEGTYSHNVEYQVQSAAQLKEIYDSLLDCWLKNKSGHYSAK